MLRPAWHIQSYVESWHPDTQVNGAAAIRTADLISMLKQGSHEPERINPRDGTRFVAVRWATAILRGYEIEVIDA